MTKLERINVLWDYAVSHPEGFDRYDVEKGLGWDNSVLSSTARGLRLTLGDDTINLVSTPRGQGEAWLYQLVGTYAEAEPWTKNRLGDTETRLRTLMAVARSIVAATDGRSTDGRKARFIAKAVGRLIEDLDDLGEES